jgi:hypothetical protein
VASVHNRRNPTATTQPCPHPGRINLLNFTAVESVVCKKHTGAGRICAPSRFAWCVHATENTLEFTDSVFHTVILWHIKTVWYGLLASS